MDCHSRSWVAITLLSLGLEGCATPAKEPDFIVEMRRRDDEIRAQERAESDALDAQYARIKAEEKANDEKEKDKKKKDEQEEAQIRKLYPSKYVFRIRSFSIVQIVDENNMLIRYGLTYPYGDENETAWLTGFPGTSGLTDGTRLGGVIVVMLGTKRYESAFGMRTVELLKYVYPEAKSPETKPN